ncbi:hypothetical protein RGI145_12345 [Roseomonas gilardii]|uniref:Uncharacterized protein n=1 Tax=Roseomonas gilardii TaxID=257708 RepID=A0A1L7AG61_9PROT|nr:hypothetical protein [Roseomonas gilardii]APT57784.1 hypothetical protein RGI145_12345 [Roseomonas gilardii]
MVTVAELGQRALRRLGVAIVPPSARPAAGAAVGVADVANRALRRLGVIVVPTGEGPGALAITTVATLAERALRQLGINPYPALSQLGTDQVPWTMAMIGTAALQRLGVLNGDEGPSATDAALALQKVRTVHDLLVRLSIAGGWPADGIPSGAAEMYVIMVAQELAPAFGKPADMQLFAQAKDLLKLEAISGAYGQTLAEGHVRAVHDSLAAAGLVDFAADAIPQAYSDDYVELTAAHLAPAVGKTADVAGAAAATEARVRRAMLLKRASVIAAEKVEAFHQGLNAQGLVEWTSAAVPAAHAEDYAEAVAAILAPMFDKPVPPDAIAQAEIRIRRASILRRAPELATEKVQAVHARLDAIGMIRWSSLDIPDYAEEPYVLMAANLLAPLFERQASDADEIAAMRLITKATSLSSAGEPVRAEYF